MKLHKHYLFFFALLLCLPIQAQRVKTDRSTGNKGFVDKDGKVLIPFLYAELPKFLDSVMIAKKGAYRGLIDNKGNILLPFQYLELRMPVDHTGQTSGLVLVKNTAGQWGIADLSGNLILQPQYEVVAAIDKTLLASRKKADRELQFYDGTGKPLFTLEGDRADRGFDANSMLVIGWGYKARYLTRNGKAIFPDNVHDIKWTDGNLIVSGGYNSQGLTNAEGDTLLPFEYWAIRPGLVGQFWVQNKNYEQAILDITGKAIVPFDRWEIRTYDNYYRACKKTMRECGFYSASGKVILPAEYNISAYKSVEPYDGDPAAEPDFLFRVGREKAPYRSGLYLAKDATQILPIEYQYIYFKDGDFPILAIRENEDQISEAMAFDLSGNPLLDKYTRSLRYTSNPGCLLSANKKGKWAFLNLNNRGSDADYRYSSPIQIRDDYYYCWVNDTVALMQLCGKQLYAGMLTNVIPANDYFTKLFQKTPNTKGRLLLVGKKPEMGPHECIGLNEEGEEFYLSDADLEVSTISTPAPL
ncbi:MAG: WG repeat-containing protein [Saprospiraceae bacterium]